MSTDREHYDEARSRYTAAIQPILLAPGRSRMATLLALIDCVACTAGGAVPHGLPQHEIVARFTQSLAEAVQVAGEKDGAH